MQPCQYVWEGVTPSTPGTSKISEPIDALKDNYSQITGVEALCLGKDGNYVNIPFESPSEHVQIVINEEGAILCDATGNFINCPIHVIVSYYKLS